MSEKITATDVEEIYQKIEKSKKGSFFIDNSHKTECQITPNHVEKPIGDFYTNSSKKGFDKATIKEDGSLAAKIIEGLV